MWIKIDLNKFYTDDHNQYNFIKILTPINSVGRLFLCINNNYINYNIINIYNRSYYIETKYYNIYRRYYIISA